MPAKLLHRLGSSTLRQSLRGPLRAQTHPHCFRHAIPAIPVLQYTRAKGPASPVRSFHTSPKLNGILPEVENPAPKESEPSEIPTVPTDISTNEYHDRADEFLGELVTRLEQAQETRTDLEIDYSNGVLEVSIPSKGIYVLNKQPPNKQIWLSSPVSGPKRFDWVVFGEGLHQKEGAGEGDWIYLRDGTSLTELLRKEIGVKLGLDENAPQ